MATKRQIRSWIEQVCANPYDAMRKGGFEARDELARLGAQALPIVLDGVQSDCPEGQHPRDVAEALDVVLHEMARHDPQPLIDALRDDPPWMGMHQGSIIDALGSARKKEGVAEPLIEAIRDRSSNVRAIVIPATNTIDLFRDPRGMPSRHSAGWKGRVATKTSLMSTTRGASSRIAISPASTRCPGFNRWTYRRRAFPMPA